MYNMIDEQNTIQVLNELIERIGGKSVDYIKLIKNTKGYNWEIKALTLDVDEIEKLNNKLFEKFGGTDE